MLLKLTPPERKPAIRLPYVGGFRPPLGSLTVALTPGCAIVAPRRSRALAVGPGLIAIRALEHTPKEDDLRSGTRAGEESLPLPVLPRKSDLTRVHTNDIRLKETCVQHAQPARSVFSILTTYGRFRKIVMQTLQFVGEFGLSRWSIWEENPEGFFK